MMEIVLWPNSILEQKAEKVTDFTDIPKLAARMMSTMKDNNGIGLAGNQVGVAKRILVMCPVEDKVLVNPEIVDSLGSITVPEGCLSFPGEQMLIERAGIVVVKYQDANGIERQEKFGGLSAIVIQHEVDHLDGITFGSRRRNNAELL